jgi:hypothetical protein
MPDRGWNPLSGQIWAPVRPINPLAAVRRRLSTQVPANVVGGRRAACAPPSPKSPRVSKDDAISSARASDGPLPLARTAVPG